MFSDHNKDPLIGTTVESFIIQSIIADGTTGRVYEARHIDTSERAAIKILHAHVANDPVGAERFKRECETLSLFNHENIVRLKSFGAVPDGRGYMIMELLKGEPLSELSKKDKHLSTTRILNFATQIAAALQYAHSHGIIHRDLKPANVMVCGGSTGDVIKVLDFGSAKLQLDFGIKLTAPGTTIGSPYYMAPEQAAGRTDIDGRVDVFSLTTMIYELLSGEVPFGGRYIGEIIIAIIDKQPKPLSQVASRKISPEVDAVFVRGLAKDKTQRYSTPKAFVEALNKAFGSSQHDSPSKSSSSIIRPSRLVIMLVSLIVISIICVLTWALGPW